MAKRNELTMSSYYRPAENGTKVNMIKEKFERKLSVSQGDSSHKLDCRYTEQESKDCLRRSSSASPMRCKKNLKLNVSRQLSNPGKNIKRTPAFRGEKAARIRNLNSPTKEKLVSIVDRNVKIFEDKPTASSTTSSSSSSSSWLYGKFGRSDQSGKALDDEKHDNAELSRARANCCNDDDDEDAATMPKETRISVENRGVRTRVISRQKNISPIYRLEDEQETTINGDSRTEQSSYKFFKNGDEYTSVKKRSQLYERDENEDDSDDDDSDEIENDCLDKKNSFDAIDGCQIAANLGRRYASDHSVQIEKSDIAAKGEDPLGSTDALLLMAALEAPLPSGPPPKKPPRTFAHGSRWQTDTDKSIVREERVTASASRVERDSKKMLEKLEHVLIQHQKALGAKVIVARSETTTPTTTTTTTSSQQRDKAAGRELVRSGFRLSRTLEDSKKSRSHTTRDSRDRKHSTFDCLPLLNCASSSNVYERVREADFKSYRFIDLWPLPDSSDKTAVLSRSEDSIQPGEPARIPSEERSHSSQSITFLDQDRRNRSSGSDDVRPIIPEERVYAEPFAFDKNSGTDITSYGILNPDERNYFSRSLRTSDTLSPPEPNTLRFHSARVDTTLLSNHRHQPTMPQQLHYMCTSIEPLVYEQEDNNNITKNHSIGGKIRLSSQVNKNLSLKLDDDKRIRCEPEKHDKIKVERLLNEAFGKFVMAGTESPSDSNASSDTDSFASSASIGDEFASFNEKLRLFKNWENTTPATTTMTRRPSKDELHRSLTEKRKNYVRRVSSKYSERRDPATNLLDSRHKLFQVCLLVELNLSTREPYIKDKYPTYATTPAWIEHFCFPDATDWPPNSLGCTRSGQNQFYTLALMDERGNRRYGYCCRVRPEGGPILPLAYCLITEYRASGFYRKVLLELESRHGLPDKRRRSFIEELYNSPMPKPGQSLHIRTSEDATQLLNLNNESRNNNLMASELASRSIDNSSTLTSGAGSNSVTLGTDMRRRSTSSTASNSSSLANTKSPAKILSSPCGDSPENSIIVRSSDPRLEERDMSQLFDAVSNKVLVILFGSLLLERKVVLLCGTLSKLSSCVEALQSLLYPFTWPHTFIPVLPDIPGLSEILQAPLPFVIGIFKSKNAINAQVASVQDGIVVDLDTSKIVCAMGDETSILPSRLQKKIRSALQLVSGNTKSGDGIRNFLVSEAFLRAFVETCSHYDRHIVTQQDGKVIFQKESFVKAFSTKTEQYFLEWFVETTMFNTFIQDCIERVKRSGSCSTDEDPDRDDIKLFAQRIAEYRKGCEKSSQAKKACPKKKTLGDRFKDLTNFHV